MLPNPVYHQVAFALIMTFSIIRSIMATLRLPSELRSKIGRTLAGGVTVFVLGFAIWNADNYFCVYLRSTRQWLTDHGVGQLGHFTEGHGWWHLMTGYGAYRIFTACIRESAADESPSALTHTRTLPCHQDEPGRMDLRREELVPRHPPCAPVCRRREARCQWACEGERTYQWQGQRRRQWCRERCGQWYRQGHGQRANRREELSQARRYHSLESDFLCP